MAKLDQTKKIKKKYITGRRFMLTIHGQKWEDFLKIQRHFETEEVERAVIAREYGESKIKPHWQCYYENKHSVGPSTGRRKMEEVLGHRNYHIEVSKGTSEANIRYIYAVDKPHEMGFVDYNKNCSVPWDHLPNRVEFWNNFTLRPFQKDIVKMLMDDKGKDRHIFWFYESKGNSGKTKLQEYLHIYHGAIITGGAAGDMKYAFARWQQLNGHSPVFILINLSRSDSFNSASAKALESLKDGLFFSGKYESGMVHARDKAAIAVFANVKPDKNLLSLDRWQIYRIDDSLNFLIKE